MSFARLLLDWHAGIDRPMPWKGSRDAYRIWLSEIILQQTRLEQGLPYYERFVAAYPTITDLAQAPEAEVLKLWEGLGYYSRARNLHATAKYIHSQYNGVFPQTYAEILALKGVGAYTAAAIASFAFGLPYAVLDGNVYRVLARFFGIDTPIDSSEGKKQFARLAQEQLDATQPSAYNQAIMDFGAVHCKPAQPLCAECPMATQCQALQQGRVAELPIKEKKLEKKNRFFNYLVFNKKDQVQIHHRQEKDIWQQLYDFPLIETDTFLFLNQLEQDPRWMEWMQGRDYRILSHSKPFKQTLSHQQIIATFIEIELSSEFFLEGNTFITIERKKIANFAFPKIVRMYLGEGSLPFF